jgi:MerR family transcriptional regulator, thiopeptide resistance regulator
MYRIQQFAQLAGVTVRTLHHYDRLGLLTPRHRTESGYRLYALEDLAQLQRILVLRYLGLPLREIIAILQPSGGAARATEPGALAETLTRQASILRERRDGVTRVLRAIEHAQRQLASGTAPDVTFYTDMFKEINMQQTEDWRRKYYSDAAAEALKARQWTPELQAKITDDWNRMFAKVDDALARNVDPTSAEGKSLAAEWMGLVGQFTQGNPELVAGLNNLYNDYDNWPEQEQKAANISPERLAFIRKAAS